MSEPSAGANPDAPTEQRYGWVIVGLAFAILGVTGGLTFYAMSAYINALVADRGFSLNVASAGPTMSAAFGGLGGLATARMMRSLSTRLIITVGTVGLGLSMAGIGASHSAWQLWAAFAASGWFGAMASGIPVSALVARWFPTSPARPLTLAMTGLAVGGALIPPAVLGLLGAFGLTKGSAILGLALIVVVGVAILFIKEPPAGHGAAAASAADDAAPSVRTRMFGLLFVGMLCLFLSQIATTAHIVRLANENHTGGAGLVVSILALGAFTGRVAGIPLMPAIGLRKLAVGVALIQAAAQLVLSNAHTEVELFLGTFLLGLAMGNVAIMQSLFAIEAYGLDHYPRMFARMSLAGPIGSGVGPLLIALIHGWADGYRWPLMLMGALSALGALALFSTGIDSSSTIKDRAHARRTVKTRSAVPAKAAEHVAVASVDEGAATTSEVREQLVGQAERELAARD